MSVKPLLILPAAMLVMASDVPPGEMKAGQWLETHRVTDIKMDGVSQDPSGFALTDESFKVCVTPQQGRNPKAYFEETGGSGCAIQRSNTDANRIGFVASCLTSEGGPLNGEVEVTGEYAEKNYRFSLIFKGEMSDFVTEVETEITASYQGPCTGEE